MSQPDRGIVELFALAGLRVSNPSLDVRARHLHRSAERAYRDVVDNVPGNFRSVLLGGVVLLSAAESVPLLANGTDTAVAWRGREGGGGGGRPE